MLHQPTLLPAASSPGLLSTPSSTFSQPCGGASVALDTALCARSLRSLPRAVAVSGHSRSVRSRARPTVVAAEGGGSEGGGSSSSTSFPSTAAAATARAANNSTSSYTAAKIALSLKLGVLWSRLVRRIGKRIGKDRRVPDFDINVLPLMLPKRNGGNDSLTWKVWRKIIYWSRTHEKGKYGEINRLAEVKNGRSQYQKVAVLGGGAFGTAMAAHIAGKGHPVHVIMRNEEVRKFINENHVHPTHHSAFDLPETLIATGNAAEAVDGCCALICALPVQVTRKALQDLAPHLPKGVPIISVGKGVETGTRQLLCTLIPEALGHHDNPVVVVSGPSFAKEIMEHRPTSVVAASRDSAASGFVQRLLTSHYFRVSCTDDVIGVEVAGAMKNVLAIAAGICEGLGLGLNAMSALVTQGNAEIRWLAIAMGGRGETLAGLSGMGDILLTCFGSLSRNRTVGVRLGRGEPLEKILSSSDGVAEGVYTSRLAVELADEYRVLLPVLTSVSRILQNQVSPRQAVFECMSLPPIAESA